LLPEKRSYIERKTTMARIKIEHLDEEQELSPEAARNTRGGHAIPTPDGDDDFVVLGVDLKKGVKKPPPSEPKPPPNYGSF